MIRRWLDWQGRFDHLTAQQEDESDNPPNPDNQDKLDKGC